MKNKEMCIYLSADFPRFKRIIVASGLALKRTLTYRNQLEALDILDEVRDYIVKYGAISSKDISIGHQEKAVFYSWYFNHNLLQYIVL